MSRSCIGCHKDVEPDVHVNSPRHSRFFRLLQQEELCESCRTRQKLRLAVYTVALIILLLLAAWLGLAFHLSPLSLKLAAPR